MTTFAAVQEAQAFLTDNPDIELIELFILDANGVPRGKLLHREELLALYESGRPLPSTMLGLSILGEDVEDSGLVWDVGDIDCRAYPLPGSLVRLPWRQIPTAAVQVSMHPSEGLPATPADPRQLLVRVIEQLEADGYHPVMACELEFYLLDQKRDAQGRPQPALDADGGRPRQTQVYGLRELEQIEPFLRDLYAACKAQGIPARTAISEYAPGQVEITLEHGPVLAAMDQAVRYKRLVKGWRMPTACRPASWPSRSPRSPAPACTCTSAWPMRRVTICSPAKIRPVRRCCVRRSAACSPACTTRCCCSAPTPTPTGVSRPTATRRWRRPGGG